MGRAERPPPRKHCRRSEVSRQDLQVSKESRIRDRSVEADEAFMRLALTEARLAPEHGDVPVGAVVVLGDALFHTLWQASGATAAELWPRHANLE